jgi:TldD protein
MLGRLRVGTPLLTLTANRSMPGGLATVQWDDEGVRPDTFPLVRDGVLVDFQTTRAQAPLLSRWYQQNGLPVRSHGCAAADSARHFTIQHRPNLVLTPNAKDVSLDDLVADTPRGLAVLRGNASVDFQLRGGQGNAALVREIVNGKLGAIVTGASYLFDSISLWRRLVAIGGASTADVIVGSDIKGQPFQSTSHTVSAVPAKLVNVTTLDLTRRG